MKIKKERGYPLHIDVETDHCEGHGQDACATERSKNETINH